MFSRTHSFTTAHNAAALKSRLLGDHVMIHNVDFEIIEEEDETISIVAHAEQIEEVKTLPDTTVSFSDNGGKTKVSIHCTIREFDKGAPMIALIFNLLIYIAGAILITVFKFQLAAAIVLAVGLMFTITFVVKMQAGYFDYIRKIVEFVKAKAA